MSPQKKATIVSTSVALLLSIIKLSVGLASGSLAILASAIDSILDMCVSLFNLFAISNSEKPADKFFNYGRGKTEALASLLEGLVITFSGFYLLYQAYVKYNLQEKATYVTESFILMFLSLFITIFLVLYLNKVAKSTKSMVIKADALHYKTDVYTNVAVLFSLFVVQLTGYEIADIIIGSAIALFIIYSSYDLIQEGFFVLLDKSINNTDVSKIESLILNEKEVSNFHLLKTREAANQIFVDVHLVLNPQITLLNAHRVSDRIEASIANIDEKKTWIINIHLDPYDDSISDKEILLRS